MREHWIDLYAMSPGLRETVLGKPVGDLVADRSRQLASGIVYRVTMGEGVSYRVVKAP